MQEPQLYGIPGLDREVSSRPVMPTHDLALRSVGIMIAAIILTGCLGGLLLLLGG